jgi:hypothetical protein
VSHSTSKIRKNLPGAERLRRSLRDESLNRSIFMDARHIPQFCRDYANCCNGARPSQALQAIPDPYAELMKPRRRLVA